MTAPAPGTFGVVRTHGLVGAIIRLGTRSQVNHAFVVVGPIAGHHEPMIVEARAKGSSLRPLSEYDGYDVIYNDQQPIDDYTRGIIQHGALATLGKPYGFLDIVALGLVSLGVRWRWLEKRVARQDRLICSQLVDMAYTDAGVRMFRDGRAPSSVTPGELLLYIARHAWTEDKALA